MLDLIHFETSTMFLPEQIVISVLLLRDPGLGEAASRQTKPIADLFRGDVEGLRNVPQVRTG